MNLLLFTSGSRFAIYAVTLSNNPDQSNYPAIEFLNDLKVSEPGSYKSMLQTLILHANNGPLANIQKSRMLKGQTAF